MMQWIRCRGFQTVLTMGPFVLLAADAAAQTARKFEVGALVSATRFVDFDPLAERDRRQFPNGPSTAGTWLEPGLGARLTYHFNDTAAAELEMSALPRFRLGGPSRHFRGQGKVQFAGGVLIGPRLGRVGVFAKVRPGIVRFGALPVIFGESSNGQATSIGMAEIGPTTCPSLDLGGVVDVRGGRRASLRIDVGNQMIWYRPAPTELNPHFMRHNLHVAMGVGFRF